MKRCIALVAVLLTVSTLFSSCCVSAVDWEMFASSLKPETIIGTWTTTTAGKTMSLTFEENGTGAISTEEYTSDITWEVKYMLLHVYVSMPDGSTQTLFDDIHYSIEDNVLYITGNNETILFYRQ